jgi:hypothetical protein
MAEKTIAGYIEGLADWRGEVVAALDGIVREAAPQAKGSIKWAQPVWEAGGPIAYAKAFPKAVNFGFWRGAELDDPDGRLIGDGDRMRHVRIGALDEVDAERFESWIREAVALNKAQGDPTRRSS